MTISRDQFIVWTKDFAGAIAENKEYLTGLDAAIGDADHGINMDRGFQAVAAKLSTMGDADIGALLKTVGTTLVSTVGGASGPLYGTAFLRAGIATSGKSELSEADIVSMLTAFVEGIKAR